MMKFGRVFSVFIVLTALFAVQCKDYVQVQEMSMPMTVKISTVSGQLLDEGTPVGLFASSPLSIDNIRCVTDSCGNAQAAGQLTWALGQTDTFPVLAYAPFDSSFTGSSLVQWQFPKDQSTLESYCKANLMAGMGTGKPALDLNIRLEHKMTSMQLRIENQIAGDTIAQVLVYGFATECQFNLYDGQLSVGGETSSIIAYRPTDGVDFFCLLYPAQQVQPYFLITMTSGRTFLLGTETSIPLLKEYVVGITGLVLTDSTPENSYSETAVVSISPWTGAHMPPLFHYSKELTLAGLDCVETSYLSNFVSCIGPATVTYVESCGQDGCMAILEDSTAALKVYALCKESYIPAGSVVRGILGGCVVPTNDGHVFQNLDLSRASIAGPYANRLMEGSVSDVLADTSQQLRLRRMHFKKVTLLAHVDGDMGRIMQNGTAIDFLIPGNTAFLKAGSTGNLVAWPDVVNGKLVLVAYDRTALDSLALPVVETAFTELSDCGIYSLDSLGNAAAILAESRNDVACSFKYYVEGSLCQLTSLDDGGLTTILLEYSDNVVPGHEYEAKLKVRGAGTVRESTLKLSCLKAAGDMAWLKDEMNAKAYILRF